ncbi:MAG: phenylacetate--CoA ligase family protein [Candidatus Hodarchaeota archaeon]
MPNRFKRFLFRNLALRFVDFAKKTHAVNSYHELMTTQWLTIDQFEDIQMKKLKKLLRHAYQKVPYYTKLFDERGLEPDHFQHFHDLLKLPVLTKKDVRANFDLLQVQNNQQYLPRQRQTSGSTGEPLIFNADQSSHSSIWASNWRAFSAGGFSLGEPIMTLSGGALMPRTTPLKQKIYAFCMNMLQLPAYHLSDEVIESYIAILRKRRNRSYLFAYASAAYLLARYLKQHRINDISFKVVFTTSEVLSFMQRTVIQETLNCSVYDTYGNNETSLYAFECEHHNGLHYGMEHSYLEVLDQNNQPVKAGETGRFIATNLLNYAMPLIRYDTGDLGSSTNDNCDCGRGLRKINKILGRSRDFILTPDGREIHGAFFNHFEPFYKTPWIAGWHVFQDKLDHITISLRPDHTPQQNDIDEIKQLLKRALGEDLRIDIVVDESLYITPAGKQKVIESPIAEQVLSRRS